MNFLPAYPTHTQNQKTLPPVLKVAICERPAPLLLVVQRLFAYSQAEREIAALALSQDQSKEKAGSSLVFLPNQSHDSYAKQYNKSCTCDNKQHYQSCLLYT